MEKMNARLERQANSALAQQKSNKMVEFKPKPGSSMSLFDVPRKFIETWGGRPVKSSSAPLDMPVVVDKSGKWSSLDQQTHQTGPGF